MFQTIVVIVILGMAALTAIGNKIAEIQQKNAGPKRGGGGQGGVQDEIERFLREVTGEGKNDGRPPQRPQGQRAQQGQRAEQRQGGRPRPPGRQPGRLTEREALERRNREDEEKRRREAESIETREARRRAERERRDQERQRKSGRSRQPEVKVVRKGRRSSPHSESSRPEVESTVAEDAQVHLPHLASGISTAGEAPTSTISTRTASKRGTAPQRSGVSDNAALLAVLRSKDEIKKAIILNEVLDKPLAMRRKSGGTS